jgi:hypothetical protein
MSDQSTRKSQAAVVGVDGQTGDAGPPPIPSGHDRAHQGRTVPGEKKQLPVTLQPSTKCRPGIGDTRRSPRSDPEVENIGDIC